MREYTLRFAVALGGFLIFIGIIMVGVFAVVFFNSEEVSPVLDNPEYASTRMLSLWILLAVGVLDIVSGILLRRKWLR